MKLAQGRKRKADRRGQLNNKKQKGWNAEPTGDNWTLHSNIISHLGAILAPSYPYLLCILPMSPAPDLFTPSLLVFLFSPAVKRKMNIVKQSIVAAVLLRPTAVVGSLSLGDCEAIFGSSAHKGSYRLEQAPVSRLLPLVLVSLICCVPACQKGLCVKSAHALTPTHARIHISGLPQQESIHQRLKSPSDVRHYAELPGPHVPSDTANCTAAPFKPLLITVSMLSD